MIPKVFVGTMYSGENELADCLAAVASQDDVDITHHIITGERELQAHRRLYRAWNADKDEYVAFVQIDADTVLDHQFVLKNAVDMLAGIGDGFTSLQYPLADFLTNHVIMGLNVYSPAVIFDVPDDEVYCDRSTRNNKTSIQSECVGYHSPDPSNRQAFHFGLHRGLKNKHAQIAQIRTAYTNLGDDRRLMALLGFEMSSDFRESKLTSYSDDEFEQAFVNACIKLKSFKETL